MTKIFARGELTDQLLVLLAAQLEPDILVGDHQAPAAGGWSGAEPGQGKFIPYVVLTTNPGARNQAGNFGRDISPVEGWDWKLTYKLASYGGARNQADYVADAVRACWDGQSEQKLTLGEAPRWKAFMWNTVSMGALTRLDAVQPPSWEIIDEMSMALTRCRA